MAEIIQGITTAGLFDGVLTGLVKFAEEEALKKYIGNGTIMSGAIKLVAGTAIKSGFKGKVGTIVGNAFQIDGTEDIAYYIWTRVLGRGSSGNGNNNEPTDAYL